MQLNGKKLLAMVCALAAAGVAQAGVSLLGPLSVAQQRAGSQDSALAAIVANPATARYSLWNAQADALKLDTDRLSVEIEPGFSVEIARLRSYTNESGNLVWLGTVASKSVKGEVKDANDIGDDPLNALTLVREGDKITGNLRVQGQLYQIRPLKDSRTALILANEARAPKDHPEEFAELAVSDIAPLEFATRAPTVIRVMVHATTRAASKSGSISSLIDLAVAETNRGYTNSGVDITMQLAGKYTVAYTESGSFSTDLARYRGTSDGYIDSIHTTRNSVAADIGVLLIDNSTSCGLASAIGASASTAFAAAHWDCATGYYSFGHEVGHLQAARHDPANDPTTTPYAYGHGFQYAAGGWRTIMAYACASANCTRLNFWSNPAKTYNGVAMGTTAKSNNARVLNNTKSTIAGFR